MLPLALVSFSTMPMTSPMNARNSMNHTLNSATCMSKPTCTDLHIHAVTACDHSRRHILHQGMLTFIWPSSMNSSRSTISSPTCRMRSEVELQKYVSEHLTLIGFANHGCL